MRILISGACGFAGSAIARALIEALPGVQVQGCDNFIRPGSETNRAELKRLGVALFHADLRAPSDLEGLPPCDWIVDAAANPSVLAGVDGKSSSRQLLEHNLIGTVNLLEHAKRHGAGFILLSTSRVYSIPALASVPLAETQGAFRPSAAGPGFSPEGINEEFSTAAPVSLYGATKLASEALALEYGETFHLPVYVNRCGVLAGAGQFGRADQGIFAFWLNSWLRRRPLKYLGFGGHGWQVRDCLHPRDVAALIQRQLGAPQLPLQDRLLHVAGGAPSARSLLQISEWCAARWGAHPVIADGSPRPFDLAWVVLDWAKAHRVWGWRPSLSADTVMTEIAEHAEAHPHWLDLSAPL
jgi:CDP-paratose 2-epimerase